MASTFSLTLAKWTLDIATKVIKADVRLHNAEAVRDDMSIIFVVNHFTRLETMLMPYIIHKHTGKEIWALAAAELFQGRVGDFLHRTGAVSTKDPDRDKIIVNSLLQGEHPWMIFPEGAMIKDKKVVGPKGAFAVYNDGQRRPPHKGAAVLALRTAFYRRKIECLHERPGQKDLDKALAIFDLPSAEPVLNKHTVIIPVNITYFPMRAHENLFTRLAAQLTDELSPRAEEELSVEGTVLAEDTDIDIVLGEPIDVADYLDAPEYAEVMACSLHDMAALETDPGSLFNDAARRLTLDYMRRIYDLTTVNCDHVFASLLRHQWGNTFDPRGFRSRAFFCLSQIEEMRDIRKHELIPKIRRSLVFGEQNVKFDDFIAVCLDQGALIRQGDRLVRNPDYRFGQSEFHTVRRQELTEVIANEIEPLTEVENIIRRAARLPGFYVARQVRERFVREDLQLFEEEYARFYDPELTKGPDVGRPFFLKPWRPKAGIVMAHGYMAAPLEVRALSEFLYRRGYAVYGVRLRGHGTSPRDLAQSTWEEWYESLNRGYAIVRSLTEDVYLSGFSTGGCLALIAAARKKESVRGVISICAPLKLQNYSVRLAPSLVSLTSLLKRFGADRESWEYVENQPENKHINYTRNPLTGVKELVEVMGATDTALPDVHVPTVVIQGSKDNTVNPASAQLIFDKLGTPHKELAIFERERHGIINGEGCQDIFERVDHFIERIQREDPQAEATAGAA